MYTVTREIGIDAGHRVPFHDSQCKNLHGHRYEVLATARASDTIDYDSKSSSAGMLVDFGALKKVMMEEIHDRFDHKLMLWEDDRMSTSRIVKDKPFSFTDVLQEGLGLEVELIPVIPTAEELARYWFDLVDEGLRSAHGDKASGLRLQRLEVFETPNNKASYTPYFN